MSQNVKIPDRWMASWVISKAIVMSKSIVDYDGGDDKDNDDNDDRNGRKWRLDSLLLLDSVAILLTLFTCEIGFLCRTRTEQIFFQNWSGNQNLISVFVFYIV